MIVQQFGTCQTVHARLNNKPNSLLWWAWENNRDYIYRTIRQKESCLVTWRLSVQQDLNPLDTTTEEPQKKDINTISHDWCTEMGGYTKVSVGFLLFYCGGKTWKKWKLAVSKKNEEQRLSWGKADRNKRTTGKCLHTHRAEQREHLLRRAGVCVAEMVAQYGFGGGITHGGVDLNLLVLQTDRFGGDTTCRKRHREAGLRREGSKTRVW